MNLPTGLQRWFFRLPIYFYRWGLGWLVPKRFLLLVHIGRTSGEVRYAVVEVADYDPKQNVYYIVSGYGEKSHWYKNLLKTPDIQIQLGMKKLNVHAKPLTAVASGERMVKYAETYPRTARQLMAMLGYETDESIESYRDIGENKVRFVALHVKQ